MDDEQMEFYTHEKCYKHIERMWRPFEKSSMGGIIGRSRDFAPSLHRFEQIVRAISRPLIVFLLSPLLYFFQDPLEVEEMKVRQ